MNKENRVVLRLHEDFVRNYEAYLLNAAYYHTNYQQVSVVQRLKETTD